MNAIINTSSKIEKRVLLSTLWIFVMFNMLKADILSLYIPGMAEELASFAGATPIPLVMLVGAILVEISTLMVVLARVLPYRANRWTNILVSIWTIVFVWGGMTNQPHYIFIGAVETITLLLIIWIAWTRTREAS